MKTILIPIHKIVQKENARMDYKITDLSDLMHSIKKEGLLQPIGVRALNDGQYETVFGNRRLLACIKLDWADIPANVLEATDDNDRDLIGLIENFKREDISVAEEGRIFTKLKKRGLTDREIATRLNVGIDRIELGIGTFSEIPEKYHNKIVHQKPGAPVGKGKIAASTTYSILKLKRQYRLSTPDVEDLLEAAKAKRLDLARAAMVAGLIREGFTSAQAIDRANRLKRVNLFVYVPIKEVDHFESFYETTLSNHFALLIKKHSKIKVTLGNKSRASNNLKRSQSARVGYTLS